MSKGMVTFRNAGRYGNQLFQIAVTYCYAKKHGLEFTLPTKVRDEFWQPVYYLHLVNKNYNPHLPKIDVTEKGHAYQEIPFEESWRDKNIVLHGYWQSWKYIEEFRQDIINLFGFYNAFPKTGYTAIFCRRGDYVNNPTKFPPTTVDYVTRAMRYILDHVGEQKFIICSDDIEWAKATLSDTGNEVEFSTGLPFDIEMRMMAACDNQISANSTFSWWSGWANQNPNKIVIAPKDWFGVDCDLDTSDVCPESWIRL